MKCPECEKLELRSTVMIHGGVITTDMAHNEFYDEAGNHHTHNPNLRTVTYQCSNGHEWLGGLINTCWCGWRSDKEMP